MSVNLKIDEFISFKMKLQCGDGLLSAVSVFRKTKECLIYAIPDRSTPLLNVIKEHFRPGKNIIPDCWRSSYDIPFIQD